MKFFVRRLLVGVMCVVAVKSSPAETLKWVVNVPPSTPPGAQIEVTGAAPELCSWHLPCMALKRVAWNRFEAEVSFQEIPQNLEYKITRGNWDSEEADPRGYPVENHRLTLRQQKRTPSKKGARVREEIVSVANWKDQGSLRRVGQVASFTWTPRDTRLPPRQVSVWVPPGPGPFPVIYAQDGENIFDPQTSTTGIDWALDDISQKRADEGHPVALIVGIRSTSLRDQEYERSRVLGASYAAALVEELKPMIEARYPVRRDREGNFLLGSSRGAVFSLEMLWGNFELFSAAAGVSNAAFIDDEALMKWVQQKRRPTLPVRVYVDHGDRWGDEGYAGYVQKFYDLVRNRLPTQLLYAHYERFEYAGHSEIDWARRAPLILSWMLDGKTNK